MYCLILWFLMALPFCLSQHMKLRDIEEELPKPYTFGYEVHDKHGDQWRSEESDGYGHVQGSYGFVDNDGMHREVRYVADDGGFRAQIRTNEPGMDIPNPADVVMIADPPSDYDATIYGVENLHPGVRSEARNFYKYQKFAKPSSPPVYVVNGHLQSPWFPMDTVAQV